MLILGMLLAITAPHLSRADENVRPAAELLREGYLPVEVAPLSVADRSWRYAPHKLEWPIAFRALGNVMAQFQPFGYPPYFHGGIDVVTSPARELHATVEGRLEAGHYGYSNQPDGSLLKHWRPWPQDGNPTYFELAVINDDGVRFEYHHVDRERLPQAIIAKLDRGNSRVVIGELLGHPVEFGQNYDHIHYNIRFADGTVVNPEFASKPIPDHQLPTVVESMAVARDGSTRPLTAELSELPAEFVVVTFDTRESSPYQHPPSRASIRFENGAQAQWDFRQSLTREDGSFPPLTEVFASSIRAPSGRTYTTDGGYGTGQSVIRLKTPPGAHGAFTIELEDAAGNISRTQGRVRSRI